MRIKPDAAIRRLFERELRHCRWLNTHLPKSQQLRRSQRRLLVLRTKLAELTGTVQTR